MTPEVRLWCHGAPQAVQGGVLDLLSEVDAEFVPRLSQRAGTLALHARGCTPTQGLSRYFDALQGECWLAAMDQGQVVGLLTFVDDHEDSQLAAWSPHLYATTVAVAARARRTGVGDQLYDAFETAARVRGVPYLTTRTWTTNYAHLRLLRERGFCRVSQLTDDRAEGIGTVYLAYRINDSASRSPSVRTSPR